MKAQDLEFDEHKIEIDQVSTLKEYLTKLEDRIKKLENPKSDWVANSKGGV